WSPSTESAGWCRSSRVERGGTQAAPGILPRWGKITDFRGPPMTETLTAAPASGDGLQTVQLSIEKIYVKDLSLENPGAPQSFQLTDTPQVEIGLRTRGEQVAPDVYECVLTLTVHGLVLRLLRPRRAAACRARRRGRRQDSRR